MRLRLSWVVFAVLVPNLAFADRHWADNYLGIAKNDGGSTVKGVHQSFGIEFFKNEKLHPLGVVPADFSVNFADQETQVIYMAGPRYTWAMSTDPNRRMHASKVLLQALFGMVYLNNAASASDDKTSKDFALGLGVGYEFVTHIKGQAFGVRAIYDRIKQNGDRDAWFDRVSAGFTYRWEK